MSNDLEQRVHQGHRTRMIMKLMNGDTLYDHEILEIMLYYAIPRKNTNDLAHELLKRFGSINAVMCATPEQLRDVDGIGESSAAYLTVIKKLYNIIDNARNPIPSSLEFNNFSEFIKKRYSKLTYEIFEVFLIDRNRKITNVKTFTNHSPDTVSIDPNDITKFISTFKPNGVIIAHNHPGVICMPSSADDDTTMKYILITSACNIRFYDHLGYGINCVYSYLATGKLSIFKERMDVNNIINEFYS